MNPFEGLAEFIAVIEAGSFSRAARNHGVSVAHVSRQVAALELRLGTKLFARTTRQVRPTEAGAHLAARSGPLLEALQHAQDSVLRATERLAGPIRLSMVGPFAEQQVVPLLAKFCAAHPRVRVEVDVSSQAVDLLDGRFDFALRVTALEDSSALIARRFAEIPMTTVASPALIARLEDELGVALTPLTVPENRCLSLCGWRWRFRRAQQVCVIEPAGPLTSNSSLALANAAAAGLGVVQVPAYCAPDARDAHKLMPVFTDWDTKDSIVFHIVYARNRFMPARVRLLIEYLLSCDLSYTIAGGGGVTGPA
ncbi:MAG: LysR family transcriptional regulator [Noviherbaspirillum sp.]